MRSTRSGLAAGLALTVAAGALAACSGGADASSQSADGSTTVTIGIMTPMTGPASSSFGQDTVNAAQARVKLANDTNEIPGVKIKLVSEDEGSSVDTSTSALKRLVEQKGSMVVLAAGVYFWGSYRYADQHKIPVVGDCIDGPECGDPANETVFATFGSSDNDFKNYTGIPEFFKSQGGTKYCGVSYDAPSPASNGKAMAGSVKAAGLPVPYTNFALPRGAADFPSIALSVKRAGCDVIGSQMQLADSLGLVTALKNAGVGLKTSFLQGGYGQALLENPTALSASQGVTMAAGYAPWSLDLPGVKRMKDALKTYAGWTKPYPAAGFQWGWFTADTAITGLKAAGAKPSQQSFVEALRKVTSDDHAGLTCPVDYSKFGNTSQQFPGNCTWMVKVTGKEFVSVTGNDPVKIVLIPGTKNS